MNSVANIISNTQGTQNAGTALHFTANPVETKTAMNTAVKKYQANQPKTATATPKTGAYVAPKKTETKQETIKFSMNPIESIMQIIKATQQSKTDAETKQKAEIDWELYKAAHEGGLLNDQSYKYDYMTDDEVNHLMSMDRNEWDNYLSSIDADLEQRFINATISEAESAKEGAGKTAGATYLGARAGYDDIVSGIQQVFQGIIGNENPVEKSAHSKANQTIAPTLKGGAAAGNTFGYVGGQMVPTLLTGGMGAAAGTASTIINAIGAGTAGISTGGNAYADAVNQGYTPEKARAYGVLQGIKEGGMQYLLGGTKYMSGNLLGKTGVAKAAGSALEKAPSVVQKTAKLAAGSAEEANEEYWQSVLDPVMRNIALGENNQINLLDPQNFVNAGIGAIFGAGTNAPSIVTAKTTADVPAITAKIGETKANEILGDGQVSGQETESATWGRPSLGLIMCTTSYEINKPWLDEAIKRGDNIVLATKPTGRAISYIDINTGKEIITGFGREYNYLLDNDYVYDAFTNMHLLI